MRTGISITVSSAVRRRLQALVGNRNAARKRVWRWQERFMKEGFEGLLRDKTRPSRIARLGADAA